ncbi:MAG: AI-2E family transporter [Canibacter sp.]
MASLLDRFRRVAKKARDDSRAVVSRNNEHPAIVHADPERMDRDTRSMYLDAKQAAAEAEAERVVEPDNPPFRFTSPFQTGFVVTLGALTALLLAGLLGQLTTVMMYVVGALFIALGLDPIVRMLERRKLSRGLAITIVYFAFLIILAGILGLIIPILADQISILVRIAPAYFFEISHQSWFLDLSRQLSEFVDLDGMVQMGQDFVSDPENLAQVAGGVLQAGVGIANGVTAGIIVLILSLYFLASLRAMKRGFYSLVQRTSRARVIDITEQVTQSVGGYVSGQAFIAFMNSLLGFIMMTIIDVPFAAVVAVVVFLLALIPLVGALTATGVVTIVALFNSPTTALIALIYYLIYMQVEAYILTPRVMSRVVKVPGAFVVIGALTGGTLLGLLGALIAIPVTASAIMIVKQVWIPRQDRR